MTPTGTSRQGHPAEKTLKAVRALDENVELTETAASNAKVKVKVKALRVRQKAEEVVPAIEALLGRLESPLSPFIRRHYGWLATRPA